VSYCAGLTDVGYNFFTLCDRTMSRFEVVAMQCCVQIVQYVFMWMLQKNMRMRYMFGGVVVNEQPTHIYPNMVWYALSYVSKVQQSV
jgi:hypothetical protein